jgi:hypothetical protein
MGHEEGGEGKGRPERSASSAAYENSVDYGAKLRPPLTAEDAAWVGETLGSRSTGVSDPRLTVLFHSSHASDRSQLNPSSVASVPQPG